jgi:hypothetical protein
VGELANARHWEVRLVEPGPNFMQDPNFVENRYSVYRIDGGVVGRRHAHTPDLLNYPSEDYVQAVGLLVALGDWVTTRSNVWTIYGTLRGDRTALRVQLLEDNPALSFEAATRIASERVDERAIRFEETVDRLPSFLKPGFPPRRIGERRVRAYNITRAN